MQLGARLSATEILQRGGIWPGLGLAVLIGLAAMYLADVLGTQAMDFDRSPVSPILLAILGGLALRNLVELPEYCTPGILFALNRLLKLGIILMGARLSLAAVGAIGLESVPVVIGCIATALAVVSLASRRLQLAPTLAALIAVGTSICGCTAIMAAAPAVRASRNEICYAVTCVALFGTVGMLAYPFVAHALFGDDPAAAGMLLGVGIHDTAQVVGAGLLFAQNFGAEAGLDTAVVTKLLRNLSIVVVVPALSILFARHARQADGQPHRASAAFPVFILGFLLMSLLRTVGDLGGRPFGVLDLADWQALLSSIQQGAGLLLTVAMVAVGLSTDLRGIRRLGWRPAAVGLLAAGAVGLTGISLIGLLR
jgi:uncharacterized integral membrane protein (TIGR00698 family)